jgi:hypothetical protein
MEDKIQKVEDKSPKLEDKNSFHNEIHGFR